LISVPLHMGDHRGAGHSAFAANRTLVLFGCFRVFSKSVQWTLHATGAALEHVGVDHGRADVGVAEQFLDGADIVAGFEQVCGEAMTESVATNFLGEPGVDDGCLHTFLEEIFVPVVAAQHLVAGAGIHAESARGEEELPAQVRVGGGELLGERVGKPDAAVAAAKVAIVKAFDLVDLIVESSFGAEGEGDEAVFFAFAVADHDLLAGEIDIFDAEAAAFEDTEAGAVEEFGLEKFNSI
jgi:hypothetical protein